MAAYAALVSLMQIIHQIENHPSPPIALDKQQVESLTEKVNLLQQFLEGYDSPFRYRDEADPLEMRIADAAYAAEDVIESNIVDRILPAARENQRKRLWFFNCSRSLKETRNNGQNINSSNLYEALQKVLEEMDSIENEVKEKAVVGDQLQREVFSASAGYSNSSMINNAMVGLEDVVLQLMDKLTAGRVDRQVIPILGMGGIGKTTLARNVYTRPLIRDRFDICAWATISQQYETKEILYKLLSQANKEGSSEWLSKMREDELGLALYKYLSYRRFLIVLDDMWSIEAWERIQHFFPDNNNSSRIMVTTRISNLGSHLDNNYGIKMRFLDEVSSWNMFSKIVFRGECCPLELEKIGKKIVENCRGLPLSVVVMGGLLEKLERTKECWESIRRNLSSVVNSENAEHCLKILKMSYDHLPAYLKPCFLYMGVFEEDSAIQVSTVVKLWVSQGFLKPISGKSLEATAREYLKGLIDRNLIAVDKLGSTGSVKYCRIHDLLRDICLREAQKERFYHVVGLHSPRDTYGQRGIVTLRSTSKKIVLDALGSLPHARFYISDRERVRLLPNLRLLRTLKAYDGYTYPRHVYFLKKIFQLVNLRYLAVKVHRHSGFPSSVNLLWNLQTLIVSHPRKINTPAEIWKMPQLRHVRFYKRGLCLPDPPKDGIVIMENLQTLTGVRDFKCGEEVVRRIPNIKKLGILYCKDKGNQSHDDDHFCLHNIECLQKLESLSCECDQSGDYLQKLTFPQSLKSLTLHMKRDFEMENMLEKIGSLPLLQKLKLKNGCLRTGSWETAEGQFLSLKFLSLKWCFNLEYWMAESSHFPCLERLHLIGLTDLKEIPGEIGEIPTLQSIALEYCSESAVKSAKRMVEEQEGLQGEQLPFKVVVKLWEENEALQKLANANFEVTIDKLIPLSLYLCFRLLVCFSCL